MKELNFPIAETFYSIQGEGTWTGTPMFFVRLAGCNVGQYTQPTSPRVELHGSPFQQLHPEYSTCTSYSEEEFICDTDYRVKSRMTLQELFIAFHSTGSHHINFTGGEPFIHKDLPKVVEEFSSRANMIHVETSGTLPIPDDFMAYVTCSPKVWFLKSNVKMINQYKFLVRGPKDEEAVHHFLHDNEVPRDADIFIQPIEEMGAPTIQYKFATECVLRNPSWKLSIQVHKVLGVR